MSAADTGQAAATMQVPMLDLQAQYRPIRDAVIDVVTRVCDSQRFIMGPEVEGMEREMAAYLGVTHAVGVSDGRTFEEYVREAVNPKEHDRDRRWLSATIDLTAYEGQLVEINFNTYYGPRRGDTDRRNDFALWGDPRISGH